MLSNKLFSSIGNTDRLYVDDVFSAYTYTGNGGTQTINNGIDLAGKGGLVWIKSQNNTYSHTFYDTARGVNNYISSISTSGNIASTGRLDSFNSSGFSLGSDSSVNGSPTAYVSWTFLRAPKFFDVVTYTGNGASNRALSHQLNADVGMVMVKATSTTGDWWVFHRSATGDLVLNTSAVQTASKANIPSATLSTFTVNGSANTNGVQYVAYLFAHDPSAKGIIQCGSFTTASGGISTSQNLGWEPQYLMVKRTNAADDWQVFDVMRGFGKPTNNCKKLCPNTTNAEADPSVGVEPEATGFKANGLLASSTYIYLAIRRPNKPPTTGTQVYSHLTRIGSGALDSTEAVGFAPDLAISQSISANRATVWVDRLRGVQKWVRSDGTSAEAIQTTSGLSSFDMLGVSYTADNTEPYAWNKSNETKHQRFFRRAPGFMDVVCYTGTGAARTVAHNLGVAPELMIVKSRSAGYGQGWPTYSVGTGANAYLRLNDNAGSTSSTGFYWNSTAPTVTVFSLRADTTVNASGTTYVAYLFATLPGISKVGSYTGNGSSQTINCGFSAGARFILIKRTDSSGDWFVWDTARGIVSANDPHLSLNTLAAEVTTNDSVDPNSTGFIVNQVAATNINVTSSTYLYLAIA